jgi:hypothetical protein
MSRGVRFTTQTKVTVGGSGGGKRRRLSPGRPCPPGAPPAITSPNLGLTPWSKRAHALKSVPRFFSAYLRVSHDHNPGGYKCPHGRGCAPRTSRIFPLKFFALGPITGGLFPRNRILKKFPHGAYWPGGVWDPSPGLVLGLGPGCVCREGHGAAGGGPGWGMGVGRWGRGRGEPGAGDWPTEVRWWRRAAAIRKNVWRHARDRLLLPCPGPAPGPVLVPGFCAPAPGPGWRGRVERPGEGSRAT